MSPTLALEARHHETASAFSSLWDFDLPASFGREPQVEYDFVRRAAGLFDQSYRGVLDLHGDVVDGFLQRLVSTHAADLDTACGQASSILTAKGRLIAVFQLHRTGETAFRLILGEPLTKTLTTTLQKYAFLDDISVDDRSDEIAILAVQGPEAVPVAGSVGLTIAEGSLRRAHGTIAGIDVDVVGAGETPEGGFEVWVPRPDAERVWDALLPAVEAVGGGSVGWQAADALRIEAGLTRYGLDYDEERFPTEVHHGHRLTYDKCYVGQEVLARMRTYGHANRRVFHLTTQDGVSLPLGAVVRSGENEAGTVSSACFSWRRASPLGIAMVKRKYWDSGELSIEGGSVVVLEELPEPIG